MRIWRDMCVDVWSDEVGRYVSKVVNREQYLEYWDKKLLKHLREKTQRPTHLPIPSVAAQMDKTASK